jgi:rubrerythrin
MAIPWHRPICPDPRACAPLIRSLQRFQVGESGEGRHLRRQAASTRDAVYQECIDLFIKEEQEHARLMAEILRRLGAPLLQRHWSDACFILLRRLFGLEEELLVLLVPEMIAQTYFRVLHDGTADPVLRAVFAQIMRDEDGHVAFHVAFLRRVFARSPLPKRILMRLGWRIMFRGACLVVTGDHYGALCAAGASPAKFWWDCGLMFDQVAAAVFGSAPAMRWELASLSQ